MGCTRQQLNAFFDDLLTPQRFKDYCPNGLQVEGKTDVRHLVSGVTASQALIEAARDRGLEEEIRSLRTELSSRNPASSSNRALLGPTP